MVKAPMTKASAIRNRFIFPPFRQKNDRTLLLYNSACGHTLPRHSNDSGSSGYKHMCAIHSIAYLGNTTRLGNNLRHSRSNSNKCNGHDRLDVGSEQHR